MSKEQTTVGRPGRSVAKHEHHFRAVWRSRTEYDADAITEYRCEDAATGDGYDPGCGRRKAVHVRTHWRTGEETVTVRRYWTPTDEEEEMVNDPCGA